jgi:PAS domain S-box-containing protein
MRVWRAYKANINKNCSGNNEQLHGLPYWSNKLFATMMTYLFPFFVLALIPGVYMSVISGLYVLAGFDVFVFFAIATAALVPGISIKARKSWLIGLLYLLAIVLLFYLGWYGPGMIYLLSLTIFCLLVFHGEHPFCTVYMNIGISVVVAICIHFNLLKNGISTQYTLGSWIAVSSNLIILSAVIAILLPKLFNGLQQSNDRYEIVADATNDTIWDWDLINNTILYNYGINLIFGYSLNTITEAQTWWIDKLHSEDRETVNHQLNWAFENHGTHLQLSYRFLCADGTYKHVFDRAIIVRNNDGKPIRMIGAMQDITRQKQEEQWLKLTESALKYATEAVVIVEDGVSNDQQRKIVYVNEAFTHITGFEQTEVIGLSTDLLWGFNYPLANHSELLNTFERNTSFEVELINYKKSGQTYWSSKSISPVKDSNGHITHWISIERDITQLKTYVSAIEKQNIQLKEIAWTQAHIVRTPVARIMGLADLLESQLDEQEENAELAKLITASAHELDHVIREIIQKSE